MKKGVGLSQMCHPAVIAAQQKLAMMRHMAADMILCERLGAPRRSLRVAIVTETYPPEVNGVASTVARIVAGLRELSHEIQLIRPRQTHDAPARERGDEFLMRGLSLPNYPGLRMGLPATAQLRRIWSCERPDVIHVVTESPLGWSVVQAATRLRIPLTSEFASGACGTKGLPFASLRMLPFLSRAAAAAEPSEVLTYCCNHDGRAC